LPATLKRRVCKKCHSFWVPGKTVRVRVREKRVAYTCLVCKDMRRIRIG
jgi:ribonuclease P protein subunit RPR2